MKQCEHCGGLSTDQPPERWRKSIEERIGDPDYKLTVTLTCGHQVGTNMRNKNTFPCWECLQRYKEQSRKMVRPIGPQVCPVAFKPMRHPRKPGTYFVLCGDRVKIGQAENVAERLADASFAPYPLELLKVVPDPTMEKPMHRRFAHDRVLREWFRLSPKLIDFILGLAE